MNFDSYILKFIHFLKHITLIYLSRLPSYISHVTLKNKSALLFNHIFMFNKQQHNTITKK